MNNKLDELLDYRVVTYSRRLILAYQKRMVRARDKKYAHEQYLKNAKFHADCKDEINKDYQDILNKLDHSYRMGSSIIRDIKALRKEFKEHEEKIKNNDFSGVTYVSQDDLKGLEEVNTEKDELEGLELIDAEQETEERDQDKKTDPAYLEAVEQYKQKYLKCCKKSEEELVYFFADQKAKDIFFDYVLKQDEEKLEEMCRKFEETANSEALTLNKEYSNYRRTAAIYLLLEQLGADKRADFTQKSVSRFLEFLTGVKEGNMYERVNEIYNQGYKKSHHSDLRYVRKYFEDMGLKEVAQDIDNVLSERKREV